MSHTQSERKEIQVTVTGHVGCGKSELIAAIENMCRDAGLPVTYADRNLKFENEGRFISLDFEDKPNIVLVEELAATAPQVPATEALSRKDALEAECYRDLLATSEAMGFQTVIDALQSIRKVEQVPTEANSNDIRANLYRAAISCPHTIDVDKVVLHYDAKQTGHNALAQLADRLVAAVQVPAEADSKVPAGYRLVPVEYSDEQLEAGLEAIALCRKHREFTDETLAGIVYDLMTSAAKGKP